MKVLITGGAGVLGGALVARAPHGVEVEVTIADRPGPPGVPSHRVDLADADATERLVASVAPDVVIHTAYRLADGERNIVAASAAVAAGCAATGAALVHLSTDAVFDGEHAPYGEDRPPAPIHPYGDFKTRAEAAVTAAVADAAVVRTSLIIRFDPPDATTGWVVEANRRGERVTLFTDEVRTPILVDDLAAGIWAIVALDRADRAGPWHLAGPERLSRVELGDRIVARFGLDPALIDTAPSSTFPGPRPRDISLTCDRATARLGFSPRPVG